MVQELKIRKSDVSSAVCCALALSAVPASSAWSQATSESAAAPVAFAQPVQTLTITATRLEVAPFDVPASIDVLDGSTLRDAKLQVNISEGLGAVPGLLARDRQNYAQDVQISVRGYGARSTFGIRGVRLYVDGIPATLPDGQGQLSNVDLNSVARLEVLRGAFSPLYGNASGGTIQVFTEEGHGRPRVSLGLAAGSNNTQRSSLKLTGAAGDNDRLGYVISASHFQTDGYRDHSAAQRDIGNGKFTLKIDDASKLTVVLNSVALPKAQDPLGLTRTQYNTNPRGVDPSAIAYNTRKTVDQTQLGVLYERQLNPDNNLRVLAYGGHRNTEQYQSIPASAQANPLHPGGIIDLGRDYTGGDLRWTSKTLSGLTGQKLALIAGLAYDTLSEHRLGYQNFTGSGSTAKLGVHGALRRDETNTVTNLDPYAQLSWQPMTDWSLDAGVRRSHVRFDSRDAYIVGSNPDDSGRASYGATLPAAGILYKASDSLHLYANASKGYETPTLNELAYRPDGATGLNFALQPARSKNAEIGAKVRLAGGQGTAALFQSNTSNEIVTLTNVGGRSTYGNASATRRKGLELGWNTDLTASLNLQATYTALDAKYLDTGKTMPGIAKSSAYAALNWNSSANGSSTSNGWRAGLEARALSKVYVNDANSDAASGYATVGANIGYAASIGGWQLTSFVRGDNLQGRRYAGSVIVNEGNSRYFEPAPGRTWLAGVSGSLGF